MPEPPVIVKYKYYLGCNGNVNGKLDIIKTFAEIVRQKGHPPLPEMPEDINKQDHERYGKNISHFPGAGRMRFPLAFPDMIGFRRSFVHVFNILG
jgi:hypothetical protein